MTTTEKVSSSQDRFLEEWLFRLFEATPVAIKIAPNYSFKETGEVFFATMTFAEKDAISVVQEVNYLSEEKVVVSISDYPIIKYTGVFLLGESCTAVVCDIIVPAKYEYYRLYMQSDRWRKLRNSILKDRGFSCELCESKKNLQMHHLTYERVGHENKEDLIILCQRCHENAHKN